MRVNYKKASLYYLVGNLFNKGMSFLTVPVFSRILSTSDYGIVTTYNSWVSILTMIAGLAIYMGIRAAFIDYEEVIDDFVSVSTTFTLASGGVLCLLVGLGAILLPINVNATMVVVCVLHGLSCALTQNYTMYLQMKYKYKFRTFLLVMPNLISVILSIVAVLFVVKSEKYMGRIVPTALVHVAFAIFLVIIIYRKSKVLFCAKYLRYALKISAPLVIHGMALTVLSQSDRIMITSLVDSAETGIYSLIYNFSMIATVITSTMDGVWVPWFMKKLKDKHISDINMMAKDYLLLMTCAMIAVVLVGPEVVKLLAPTPYWEGIMIIPPIVLANYVIFAYTLYVNVEHFYKKTVYITFNTVIAAVLNIALNFILIPKHGYVAAAYTTLVSYFVSFVLHSFYAKKLEKELYPLRFFCLPILQIAIAVICFYVFIESAVARWLLMIVYVGTIAVLNRKKIIVYLKK